MAKKATAKKASAPPVAPVPFRIDIGCGKNKKEGFTGVDRIKFDGVDIVHDVARHTWPWKEGTVDEVRANHVIEHFTPEERVFFFNELYRVLKKDGKAEIVLPHWASSRYYGDPTHKAPAFSEFGWHYLKKEWRLVNAPHCDSGLAPGPLSYSCDFEYSYGFSTHPAMQGRSREYVDHALAFYKEAAQDMVGNLVKMR